MRIATIILAGLLLLAAGCAGTAPPSAAPAPASPDDRVTLERGELPLSEEIETWIDAVSQREGVYTRQDGEYQHVVVAMGERMTGGYSVKIRDLALSVDDCRIEVQHSEPKPGDMVTQAITYPYLFVSIKTEAPISVSLWKDGKTQDLTVNRYEDE